MLIAHVRHTRHAQRGVSLIEAMIAVLLLAICALAFATVQLQSMNGTTGALRRSKAVQFTQSMADRIRSNQAALAAGEFNAMTTLPATPSCGGGVACTPAQAAALDYVTWHGELTHALPGAKGAVCLDDTPDDGTDSAVACSGTGPLAIKVFWTQNGQSQRVTLGVRP